MLAEHDGPEELADLQVELLDTILPEMLPRRGAHSGGRRMDADGLPGSGNEFLWRRYIETRFRFLIGLNTSIVILIISVLFGRCSMANILLYVFLCYTLHMHMLGVSMYLCQFREV